MLGMQRSRGYTRTSGKKGAPRPRPGSGCCPPEPGEIAEAFWLGRLGPKKARQFARHSAGCPECAAESDRAREFITAIRAALAEDPPKLIYKCPPIVFDTGRKSK
jgi:hypothetical protein